MLNLMDEFDPFCGVMKVLFLLVMWGSYCLEKHFGFVMINLCLHPLRPRL